MHRIKSAFDNYMNILEEKIKKDHKYSKYLSSDAYKNLLEQITAKIYNKIYPKSQTKLDIEFFNRLQTLQWLEPQHLHLYSQQQYIKIFEFAIQG